MRCDQQVQQELGGLVAGLVPARHDDDVGLFESGESIVNHHVEAARSSDRACRCSADGKAKAWHPRVYVTKHHAGHRKMERADSVEGHHCDLL